MVLRRLARITQFGIILLLLGACQSARITPVPTVALTPTFSPVTSSPIIPSPSPQPTLSPTPSLSQTLDLPQLKGTHIQFWHPYLDATAAEIQSLVNEFNRVNSWGIQVDTYTLGNPSELYRQVMDALPGTDGASGSGVALPDVVIADPEQAASWQAINPVILNLADYIADGPLGLSAEDISDYYPAFWHTNTSSDLPEGIPAEGNVQVLFYNVTWARQLGFTHPPQTTDEFRQQACRAALANRQDGTVENDGTGGWLVDTNANSMLAWIDAFGGQVVSMPSGQYAFATTEANAAFTFLKDLVGQGCAWSGIDPQPYDYFANREALFFSGNLADIQPVEQALGRAASQDTWTVIATPSVSGGVGVLATAPSYYIFQSTDIRQMAAWLFVRWMASSQNQAQLVQADGSFPLRQSEANILEKYKQDNQQWASALELIAGANTPPMLASWRQVSSLLEDAAQQLFQPETDSGQIPEILTQVDAMAVELSRGSP